MRPSLIRVSLHFLLWLLGLMIVWALWIGPTYDKVVAVVGVRILRALESPQVTAEVRFVGPETIVLHTHAYAHIKEQRLELRTHHNNTPLLFALILATPGLGWRRRARALRIAAGILVATHLFNFMLEVHFHYVLENAGPYRVTDLRYLNKGIWDSLDNPAQVAKLLIGQTRHFYTQVGRRLAPIFIWMILCWDAILAARSHRRVSTRKPGTPHPDARD